MWWWKAIEMWLPALTERDLHLQPVTKIKQGQLVWVEVLGYCQLIVPLVHFPTQWTEPHLLKQNPQRMGPKSKGFYVKGPLGSSQQTFEITETSARLWHLICSHEKRLPKFHSDVETCQIVPPWLFYSKEWVFLESLNFVWNHKHCAVSALHWYIQLI